MDYSAELKKAIDCHLIVDIDSVTATELRYLIESKLEQQEWNMKDFLGTFETEEDLIVFKEENNTLHSLYKFYSLFMEEYNNYLDKINLSRDGNKRTESSKSIW